MEWKWIAIEGSQNWCLTSEAKVRMMSKESCFATVNHVWMSQPSTMVASSCTSWRSTNIWVQYLPQKVQWHRRSARDLDNHEPSSKSIAREFMPTSPTKSRKNWTLQLVGPVEEAGAPQLRQWTEWTLWITCGGDLGAGSLWVACHG